MDDVIDLENVNIEVFFNAIFSHLKFVSPGHRPETSISPTGMTYINDKIRSGQPHLYFSRKDGVPEFMEMSRTLKLGVIANSDFAGAVLLNILGYIYDADLDILLMEVLGTLSNEYEGAFTYKGRVLPMYHYPIDIIVETIADYELGSMLVYNVAESPFLRLENGQYSILRFVLDVDMWNIKRLYDWVMDYIHKPEPSDDE